MVAFAVLVICSFGASAEFARQPAAWSSSLCASSGPDIYDWQLASMISTWIARPGFANMVLVFGECYGGGMLDELHTTLEWKGDVALTSAARHNELSWALNARGLAASRDYWSRLGFDRAITFFNKELVEELARLGSAAVTMEKAVERAAAADAVKEGGRNPAGRPWGNYRPGVPIVEHPQWLKLGNGGDVKLGFKTNGEPVESRHAILFAGNADLTADWNDLDYINMVLTQYHSFPAANVHVLAGGGVGSTRPDGTAVPNYVDGPGTREALWEAIRTVGGQMNPNEQFVFWGLDHGNRERTERAIDQVINEHARTIIRILQPDTGTGPTPRVAEVWDLDQTFLDDILAVPDNEPYVSVIAEGLALDTCGTDVVVQMNGVPLNCTDSAEIVTWDEDPDVDAAEFIFPIPDESLLGLENTIEIEWSGDPDDFTEYTILGLQISTGAMHASPEPVPVEEPQDWCAPSPADDLTVTIGASILVPGFDTELYVNGTLDLAPLLVTSETDVLLLPVFAAAESLGAGLVWDWVSVMTNLDLSLVPWALASTGGTIEITPPAWTFGQTPEVTVEAAAGWSPQWGPGGFTHSATGSVDAEAAWQFPLPWGALDATAGTSFDVTNTWPGATLFTQWDVTAEGTTVLPASPIEASTLRAGATASLFVLPALGGGVDLRLELCADAYYAHATLGLGLGGISFEVGAEFEWGLNL